MGFVAYAQCFLLNGNVLATFLDGKSRFSSSSKNQGLRLLLTQVSSGPEKAAAR